MLVSAKEMLNKAREGKYAVGQFNINNLAWTKAILLTAQENNSPFILGVSECAGKYMGCLLYTSVIVIIILILKIALKILRKNHLFYLKFLLLMVKLIPIP